MKVAVMNGIKRPTKNGDRISRGQGAELNRATTSKRQKQRAQRRLGGPVVHVPFR